MLLAVAPAAATVRGASPPIAETDAADTLKPKRNLEPAK